MTVCKQLASRWTHILVCKCVHNSILFAFCGVKLHTECDAYHKISVDVHWFWIALTCDSVLLLHTHSINSSCKQTIKSNFSRNRMCARVFILNISAAAVSAVVVY